VTDAEGRRTAPSAGALYPLELYLIDRAGAARYLPAEHALVSDVEGDLRRALGEAAGQDAVLAARPSSCSPASRRGRRRATATARSGTSSSGPATQRRTFSSRPPRSGSAPRPIGAFDYAAVARALRPADGERSLYIIRVGHPDRP
jgi:hypothetical protein